MENEHTPKPRFRWGRLLLMLVMACLLMIVGYVGGTILHRHLAKKLDELDEAEKEVEDVEHENVDDDGEASELSPEEDKKASNLVSDLLKEALPEKKGIAKKTPVIGFRPAANKTPKKK